MINRRKFLQAGVAAIPLVSVASSSSGAFAANAGATPLYKVLYEEQFREGIAFAAMARQLGAQVEAIQGDISDIWYNDLYYCWRKSPVAIAGLTTGGSLFCLDVLARDAGMRVVYHADHRILRDGSVEHEVFGAEGVRRTALLKRAGANWSAEAASLVVDFPEAACRPVGKVADLLGTERDSLPLVSWVIAPVKRA